MLEKNLMWPTHDFLEHLFNYKIFVGSSLCQIRTLCRGITPKLMKIRPCCWVSLESSQRVLFNAIEKKITPPP
ncbi:hypothetical protein O3M35_012418 [Rhynocoris fuscipes]|uniref:Uncharacterized protein n=1 Tax=Rhynocoris fuscipes TaxID=488301 RepID=A0AAW1CW69_9HEMI